VTALDNDAELLRDMARGDHRALSALYDRHAAQAFGLARRMLGDRDAAEEAVQDAFVSLWRRAGTYRSERCSARTWLFAIVRNRCIDELRRRRARGHVVAAEPDASQPIVDTAWDAAWTNARRDVVREALAALPDEQRAAIEFGFFEGYSHSEIATLTGTPLGTVKKRIRSGLRKLKGTLTAFAESTAS